MRDKEAPFVG